MVSHAPWRQLTENETKPYFALHGLSQTVSLPVLSENGRRREAFRGKREQYGSGAKEYIPLDNSRHLEGTQKVQHSDVRIRWSPYTFSEWEPSYVDSQGQELFQHWKRRSANSKAYNLPVDLMQAAYSYRDEDREWEKKKLKDINDKFARKEQIIEKKKNTCKTRFDSIKVDIEEFKEDAEKEYKKMIQDAESVLDDQKTENPRQRYLNKMNDARQTYLAAQAEIAHRQREAESDPKKDEPYDYGQDITDANSWREKEMGELDKNGMIRVHKHFTILDDLLSDHDCDHVSFTFSRGELGCVKEDERDTAVRNILKHLQFEKVPPGEDVRKNDVITYIDAHGKVALTASVVEPDQEGGNHLVESKWEEPYPPSGTDNMMFQHAFGVEGSITFLK